MLIMDLMKWNGKSLISAENCATSGSSSHCRCCTLAGFNSQCTRALQCTANLSIWRNILKLFELWRLDMWLSTLKNILKSSLLCCNSVLITQFEGQVEIIKNGDYEDYLLNLFGIPFVFPPCFNIVLLRSGMTATRPSAEINVTLIHFFYTPPHFHFFRRCVVQIFNSCKNCFCYL